MGNWIQYIDSLKGVLIILVVVGHFRYANYRYMTIVNDVIYSFHMPLFIFLSGYVVTELSFTKLAKRIRMLVLPFFFIGTLFSLCYKGNAFSWFQIANKHYFWYLLILTYCLISISLIQKILRIRPSNQKMSYLLGGGNSCPVICRRQISSPNYQQCIVLSCFMCLLPILFIWVYQ